MCRALYEMQFNNDVKGRPEANKTLRFVRVRGGGTSYHATLPLLYKETVSTTRTVTFRSQSK